VRQSLAKLPPGLTYTSPLAERLNCLFKFFTLAFLLEEAAPNFMLPDELR